MSQLSPLALRLWILCAALVTTGIARAEENPRFVRFRSDHPSKPCLFWPERNFTYQLNQLGNSKTPGFTEFTAIDAAFATWQVVAKSCNEWRFVRGPDTTATEIG